VVEALEDLGYAVEERPAELDISLVEDESPYDPDLLVKHAVFLGPGAVPLHEVTEVVDLVDASQVRRS
jgi:hypothetical protein